MAIMQFDYWPRLRSKNAGATVIGTFEPAAYGGLPYPVATCDVMTGEMVKEERRLLDYSYRPMVRGWYWQARIVFEYRAATIPCSVGPTYLTLEAVLAALVTTGQWIEACFKRSGTNWKRVDLVSHKQVKGGPKNTIIRTEIELVTADLMAAPHLYGSW